MYITCESRGFDRWCESQVNCWRSFMLSYFILIVILRRCFY